MSFFAGNYQPTAQKRNGQSSINPSLINPLSHQNAQSDQVHFGAGFAAKAAAGAIIGTTANKLVFPEKKPSKPAREIERIVYGTSRRGGAVTTYQESNGRRYKVTEEWFPRSDIKPSKHHHKKHK